MTNSTNNLTASTYTIRVVGARGSTGTDSLTEAVRIVADQTGIAFEDLYTVQNGKEWEVVQVGHDGPNDANIAVITVE